ncbi:MAG TPA: NYN domain-containing protein [Candidatus Saccharimonadia bacterium]|nr:NYN domain-containing protein [Candidatus Saccharimonadia bacterium]
MIVYLDGENVVHQLMDVLRRTGRLKSREDLLNVNLVELIKQLVGARELKVKYYTTTLSVAKNDEELEKRSQEMIAWTALWTNHLMDQGIEIIKAGKLRVQDGHVCKNCGFREPIFREKGVDVRLAVDLVVDSETDKTLVIWSSDADLVPAVEVVKGRGARVKILAPADSLTWGLARQAGEWQTYQDGQLIKIFDKVKKENQPDGDQA